MAELGKSSLHRSNWNEQFRATIFLNRMSERAGRDPRICEIIVNKVESKDLGTWRSNLFRKFKSDLEMYPGVLSDANATQSKEKFSMCWKLTRKRMM